MLPVVTGGLATRPCFQELGYVFICKEANIMSIENRISATAKNIEGKIQEAVGDITGDQQAKLEGQAKQHEAALQHTVENIKDAAKDIIDKG